MRLNYLANAIGLVMMYIGLVLLSPVVVALLYKEMTSILPFITAALISIILGYCFRKFVKNASTLENLNDIKKAEALFIVAISWVVFSFLAGIPYLFYDFSPINALFEAVSGITTTGATVLTNYNRITYIYHLLCLPPKFIQRFNEWRLNKKYEFDKKKYSNATLEDITKENEAAIDVLKEVVKDDN